MMREVSPGIDTKSALVRKSATPSSHEATSKEQEVVTKQSSPMKPVKMQNVTQQVSTCSQTDELLAKSPSPASIDLVAGDHSLFTI